jgi:quinol monooxygenase YgiN
MSQEERHWTRREALIAGGSVLGASVLTSFRGAAAADPGALIIQTAAVRLAPGKETEALAAITRMCASVEREEPGVLVYLAQRSSEDPGRVLFFEIYRDAEAAQAHGKTAHVGEFSKAFGSLLLPDGGLQHYQRLAGFMRGS